MESSAGRVWRSGHGDDDDGDDNEEKTAGKRKTKYALVVSETVEEYFEEWQEAEVNMTD